MENSQPEPIAFEVATFNGESRLTMGAQTEPDEAYKENRGISFGGMSVNRDEQDYRLSTPFGEDRNTGLKISFNASF